MKKYNFFYIALLLVCFQLYGQADFTIIDKVVPNIEYTSKESLAIDITKNCSSDIEKVRAIFIWITNNINYDYELYYSPEWEKLLYSSEDNVVEQTLEKKKAICNGYSQLFKKLCDDLGIECEIVKGYSRQFFDAIEEKEIIDHAWNVVKINDKWYPIDTTWAAKNDKEVIDDFWFLTNPNFFIYSHYPENEKWTLLEYPFSKEEFYKLPVISNRTFFEDNIRIISPTTELIEIDKNGVILIQIETRNTERLVNIVGFPMETYASMNGLEYPTNEEYLNMTNEERNRFTLIIPSVEIVSKEIINNKIILGIQLKSEHIESFEVIIDGNTVAKFKLDLNR